MNRLKTVTLMLMMLAASGGAWASENPCRQRVLKICNDDPQAGICRLLKQDAPENKESIGEFLQTIAHLDHEVQQDLICARLMGKKKILNIETELVASPDSGTGKYTFKDGDVSWRFKMPDPAYPDWVSAHSKIDRLKLCAGKGLDFDIEGVVVDVNATYKDGRYDTVTIGVENVNLLKISTGYLDGPFDAQIKPLRKIINSAYDGYMKAGLNSEDETETPALMDGRKTELKRFTNSIGMEFAMIPAGEFVMGGCGGADEKIHRVRLTKPFFMGRHEVTQGQWVKVMGGNPSNFKDCGSNCPVEQVSWEDAQMFIKKLNALEGEKVYRLPTEAEWEYTCRAGSNADFCYGSDEGRLTEYGAYA